MGSSLFAFVMNRPLELQFLIVNLIWAVSHGFLFIYFLILVSWQLVSCRGHFRVEQGPACVTN